MKARRRTPITLSVAAVLLCLVLVSAHFTSGMYARYVTRSNGADTGHIAAFQVTAEADSTDPVLIVPMGVAEDGKAEYEITVKNPGNVAVRYTAEISFEGENKSSIQADMTSFKGKLDPGESEKQTLKLDMSAALVLDDTNDGLDFSNDQVGGTGSGTIPFTVLVTFTQID